MIWVTWRQFRAQALTGVALLVAAAIYFLLSGLNMHHTYTADLASCTPQNDCGTVLGLFQQAHDAAFHLIELLVVATPALIGSFWGAPLIARELESGTAQLAWNQSVTRTRWLAVKLTGVGIASIATAGLLSYLLTWWAGPLDQINGDRFGAITFATRDIVPLAYAAFAFALGTTAGLLIRRTVPAMAVTLAVFIGIQILVPTAIRPNLLPSTTVTYAVNAAITRQAAGVYTQGGGSEIFFAVRGPQGAWILSTPPVKNSAGQAIAAHDHLNCFPSQGATKDKGPNVDQIATCLASYNLHESITYLPAKYYWPLQWLESGIFLALTAALSGCCFWWIRRRQN